VKLHIMKRQGHWRVVQPKGFVTWVDLPLSTRKMEAFLQESRTYDFVRELNRSVL